MSWFGRRRTLTSWRLRSRSYRRTRDLISTIRIINHRNACDAVALNDQVAMAIAAYHPTIKLPIRQEVPWEYTWFGRYRGSILLTWPLSGPSDVRERRWFVDMMATPYRHDRWAFPRIAGQELHPLLIWWAVLYTLSMLARYHPESWARAIDVDRSGWAVPLEHLLDQAVDALPEVVFEALEHPPLAQHGFRLPGDGILDYE